MSDLVQLSLLAVFALVGLLAVSAVVKVPGLGLALAATFAVIHWEFPVPPRVTDFAGLSVYSDDVVFGVLALAAVVNLVRGTGRGSPALVPVAIFIVANVASVLAGFRADGVPAVIVEARPTIGVCVALLWGFSVDWLDAGRRLRTLGLASAITAAALVAVAAAHAARYGLGAADEFVLGADGQTIQNSRILTAAQAIVLVVSVFVVIGTASLRRRLVTGALLIAAVLVLALSQQRTAWVALVVGLAVLWFRAAERNRVAATLAAGVVGIALLAAYATGQLGFLSGRAGTAAQNSGTYEGRVAGWKALFADAVSQGADVVVFGRPFGSGFGRFEGAGVWVDYAPHNYYLTVFLRTGIVGLVALVWLIVAALRQASRVSSNGWVLAVWSALVVLGWTYTWVWFALPVAVIALDAPFVRRQRPQSAITSTYRRTSVTAHPGGSIS